MQLLDKYPWYETLLLTPENYYPVLGNRKNNPTNFQPLKIAKKILRTGINRDIFSAIGV